MRRRRGRRWGARRRRHRRWRGRGRRRRQVEVEVGHAAELARLTLALYTVGRRLLRDAPRPT
eukprot:6451009-Prymnesium_polylepis.1